jgi:hypothetical protein
MATTFQTLYPVALLHGVTVEFDDGLKSELRASLANRQRHLEVKMLIIFDDVPKPMMSANCMFLTSLQPKVHCMQPFLNWVTASCPDAWNKPMEEAPDGKLALIG